MKQRYLLAEEIDGWCIWQEREYAGTLKRYSCHHNDDGCGWVGELTHDEISTWAYKLEEGDCINQIDKYTILTQEEADAYIFMKHL